MAFLLGNTEKLSKLHADLRANDLNIIMKRFWIKTAGHGWHGSEKKAVALESTIALLKQKAYENPECPVEALLILEIYSNYLTNQKTKLVGGGGGHDTLPC